jgi:hypothetical protein
MSAKVPWVVFGLFLYVSVTDRPPWIPPFGAIGFVSPLVDICTPTTNDMDPVFFVSSLLYMCISSNRRVRYAIE